MMIEMTRPIDREKWLEALHAKGTCDIRLNAGLDEGERLLKEAAQPRAVHKLIDAAGFETEGNSVKNHLNGCHTAALMAVTLGNEVDTLIRKTQVIDMAMAVILDAGASVMIEQLADEYQAQIKGSLYMTPRFSPGYGDWPVTDQSRIVRMLDAGRKIGLNVTKDSLLIPRKSITAVAGLADSPVMGSPATCDSCVLKNKCELRKEGKFCGDKL